MFGQATMLPAQRQLPHNNSALHCHMMNEKSLGWPGREYFGQHVLFYIAASNSVTAGTVWYGNKKVAHIGVGVTDPHGAEEVHPAAPHEAEDARQKHRVVLARNFPREDEKPATPWQKKTKNRPLVMDLSYQRNDRSMTRYTWGEVRWGEMMCGAPIRPRPNADWAQPGHKLYQIRYTTVDGRHIWSWDRVTHMLKGGAK